MYNPLHIQSVYGQESFSKAALFVSKDGEPSRTANYKQNQAEPQIAKQNLLSKIHKLHEIFQSLRLN